MHYTATVDRFEGDFIILETPTGMQQIPLANAPAMLAEGMIVECEDDRIVRIDLDATARCEAELRRRFERILGKKD